LELTCVEAIDVMDQALDRTLGAEIQTALDEHFIECDVCRAYYQQLDVTVRVLGAIAPKRSSNPRRDDLVARFARRKN
jgi:predicted anti-sigma-YlaC factor YlaD